MDTQMHNAEPTYKEEYELNNAVDDGLGVMAANTFKGILLTIFLAFFAVPFFGPKTFCTCVFLIACPFVFVYGGAYQAVYVTSGMFKRRGHGKTTMRKAPILPIEEEKGKLVPSVQSKKWRRHNLILSIVRFVVFAMIGTCVFLTVSFVGGGITELFGKEKKGFVEGGKASVSSVVSYIVGEDGIKSFIISLAVLIILLTLIYIFGGWCAKKTYNSRGSIVGCFVAIPFYIIICCMGLGTGRLQHEIAYLAPIIDEIYDFMFAILH